ncbi:MAG TPA: MFS transporter [Steroidobacteraceae bacterium]|nr:MFS transporter [Steroidobacteraceae bacterium]
MRTNESESDLRAPSALERATLGKVTRRLVPFLLLLYIVAWLDRVNVSFAALQMNQDLGFSKTAYGFGAGIFYVGYALFEIPSNLVLARVGARRWIARIMITWGIISVAFMFVRDTTTFAVLRVLLGVAEAGFLPGIIYYMTYWFPRPVRAQAVSWFMAAIPLSVVIGGPLAGGLLEMDGLLGLQGWQWLFMVEGAPAIILGVVVLFYLTDKPEQATWLAPEERTWLSSVIQAEHEQARTQHNVGLLRAMYHPTVWVLIFIMFACQTGSYGLTYWVPLIIKSVSGLSDFQVGLLAAIPYLAATAGMVLIGWNSDRTAERFLHIAVPCVIAAIGFILSMYLTSPVPAMIALTVAAVGDLGSRGPFWALPGRFLTGAASAGGIALINTVASLGGLVGPSVVGLATDRTGEYSVGLALLAPLLIAGALAAWLLRRSRSLAVDAVPATRAH